MRFLANKVTDLNIGWNQRPLSEEDFFNLCKRFKITVQEMPLRVSGFYYRVMGHDFIAIDCRLSGTQRLMVMFHELGHFLFHTPESGATANFHRVGQITRRELEADLFALCAVIPRSCLTQIAQPEFEDNFSPEAIAERIRIFERYGL